MALFGQFGNIISGALGLLGRAGGVLGGVAQLGATTVASLLPASGPVIGVPQIAGPSFNGITAQPVMAAIPRLPTMAGALAGVIQPILIKIATFLGRRTLTLRETIKMIRRFSKLLAPAAIASVLGITVVELGTVILADASRPRRRMNPANVRALRRSMRRIESFHRLCVKADTLRRPGRRGSRKAPCPTSAPNVRLG